MDEKQSEVIRKIYDMVLNPEDHEEFIHFWEKYISDLAEPLQDRRNSQGPSEVLLQDPLLEEHFARGYAIINKMGERKTLGIAQKDEQFGQFMFKFTREQSLVDASNFARERYADVNKVADISKYLDPDSAARWQTMAATFGRSPSIGKFEVFALADGGNLLTYGNRVAEADDIELVVRALAIGWNTRLSNVLRSSFKLSEKETELVRLLAEKGNLNAHSEGDKRSKHTLRSQLKSAFKKMNVSSQPELMQTVATLAQICQQLDYETASSVQSLSNASRIDIATQSGRKMPVYLFGPEEGRPVIFIHGMMDGVGLTPALESALARHNLRFIAPIRPGFGDAEANPEIIGSPEAFAEQVDEMTKVMELENVLLLGHMSGSLYAFAAARLLAEKAHGIVNISGGVPTITIKQFAVMSSRQKAFAYTARFAPKLLPMLMRAGVAQIDSMKTDELLESMYQPGTQDHKRLHADQDVKDTMVAGYRFSVAQGYKGFEADAYHVTRDWSELIGNRPVPTLLIHGRHDPVVGLQFVKEFAEMRKLKLLEFPDEGQLVLYSQPDKVIAAIAEMHIDSNQEA